MSQFVNYGKRSVSLPAGCKNLSDVLVGRKRPSGKIHAALSGTISDLARLILRISRPGLSSWGLFIFPPVKEPSFYLGRTTDGWIEATVSVSPGSATETALLQKAVERGWPQPKISKLPEPFAGLEFFGQMYCLRDMPQRGSQVADLLAEMFRELAAVDEGTKLDYEYIQFTGPN